MVLLFYCIQPNVIVKMNRLAISISLIYRGQNYNIVSFENEKKQQNNARMSIWNADSH